MIKPNNQIVLLASEAEDIDAAYDSMEGQQDYVSIGGIEIPVGFDRSENTFYLLDDGEASRDALEKAKKLLKKFGGGQLKPTPNTKDNLAGKDYVAFADGNTYMVNTYTESVKTFESKRKVSNYKKNEADVGSKTLKDLRDMVKNGEATDVSNWTYKDCEELKAKGLKALEYTSKDGKHIDGAIFQDDNGKKFVLIGQTGKLYTLISYGESKKSENVFYRGEPLRKVQMAMDKLMKQHGFKFERELRIGDRLFNKGGKKFSYHLVGQSGDPKYYDYVIVTKGEVGWDRNVERKHFDSIETAVDWLDGIAESKKSEAVGDIRRDVPINDTMYASKLKSLVRKLKTLGASVKPNVYADENSNDKSAEYKLLGVYGNDGITVDVDIYEGKHTSITVITNRGNMIMNGEGSSFASALSALGILEESNKSESKKNESTDTIKMGIDYTMFMRMCESAAFLDKDEDYWDALWEYYSGIGEIDDALVFFDNLFQYTSWKDVEETYDELPDEAKDDTKDKEEVIDAYLDENGEIRGNTVTKYGDHYLWVY